MALDTRRFPRPHRVSKPGHWSPEMVIDVAETERIWSLLADGGQIDMPMEETFFAHRFGQLRDKFGTSWMIFCPKEEAPA